MQNSTIAFDDPFSLRAPGMLFGLNVIESPDIPRYTLPPEVCPGVPWPAGFRDDINRWSLSFLGTTNAVPPGVCYVTAGNCVVMRREDVVKISNIC
jgi:hypothetical protein